MKRLAFFWSPSNGSFLEHSPGVRSGQCQTQRACDLIQQWFNVNWRQILHQNIPWAYVQKTWIPCHYHLTAVYREKQTKLPFLGKYNFLSLFHLSTSIFVEVRILQYHPHTYFLIHSCSLSIIFQFWVHSQSNVGAHIVSLW